MTLQKERERETENAKRRGSRIEPQRKNLNYDVRESLPQREL